MKHIKCILKNEKRDYVVAFLLVLLVCILMLTLGVYSQTQCKWKKLVKEYNSLTKIQEVVNESN
jgi:hypothetical protein